MICINAKIQYSFTFGYIKSDKDKLLISFIPDVGENKQTFVIFRNQLNKIQWGN